MGDGYFTNNMLLVQATKVINIFKQKYHRCHTLFIFDHVPSHKETQGCTEHEENECQE